MVISRVLLSSALVFSSALSAGAQGIGSDVNASTSVPCDCRVQPASASGPIGELTAVDGDVLASTDSGLFPAAPGTPLVRGSQVIVGEGGAANITVGSTCSLPLGPATEAVVTEDNGQLCVRTTSLLLNMQADQRFGQQGQNDDDDIAGLWPLLLIGGGVGAAFAFGAFDDDDDSDSP